MLVKSRVDSAPAVCLRVVAHVDQLEFLISTHIIHLYL